MAPEATASTSRHQREVRTKSGGIKFFKPHSEIPIQFGSYKDITVEHMRDARKVWRPEETVEAGKIFFEAGKINVIGAPQWGKGTILFGLSEIFDELGQGYVFLNGHAQDTPEDVMVESIKEANNLGYAIFFDSFDYLFLDSTAGGRTISRPRQQTRTAAIINTLSNVTVPVAITMHDEDWARAFINHALRDQYRDFLDSFPMYHIPLHMQSKESTVKFLAAHNISAQDAEFIIGMPNDEEVVNTLVAQYGDKDIVSSIFDALTAFPILKELVRTSEAERTLVKGRGEEFIEALELAKTNKKAATLKIAELVREAEQKLAFLTVLRRKK